MILGLRGPLRENGQEKEGRKKKEQHVLNLSFVSALSRYFTFRVVLFLILIKALPGKGSICYFLFYM